jgi:4-carboxymuconolactone decarboxylase
MYDLQGERPMKHLEAGLAMAALAASMAGNALAQEDLRRFKLTPFSDMTPAQRAYADAVMSGPVSATGSAAVVPGANTIGSPFNVYLRSPELAQELRKVGEHIRFKSSLPPRLNEFAILVTARHWGSQYEWVAHHRLALKAGLNPAVAEELAQGKRPSGMHEDETAIYNFSHELHNQHAVSDATYKAVADKFGEQGVVDLIAVNGYYVLVSMILNVDRTPVPGGGKPPLPPLK